MTRASTAGIDHYEHTPAYEGEARILLCRGKEVTVAMLTYVVIAVTHHRKDVYTHND